MREWEQDVHPQRQPGADETLAGAVVGAGRAPSGEDDADAEEQRADDDRGQCDVLGGQGEHPGRLEGEDAGGLDGDDDEEGHEPAALPGDPDVAQRAGDAEAAALQHEAERDAEEESGEDHGYSS